MKNINSLSWQISLSILMAQRFISSTLSISIPISLLLIIRLSILEHLYILKKTILIGICFSLVTLIISCGFRNRRSTIWWRSLWWTCKRGCSAKCELIILVTNLFISIFVVFFVEFFQKQINIPWLQVFGGLGSFHGLFAASRTFIGGVLLLGRLLQNRFQISIRTLRLRTLFSRFTFDNSLRWWFGS